MNVAASYRSHTQYTLTLSIYLDDIVDDNRWHQLYLHLQQSRFLFFCPQMQHKFKPAKHLGERKQAMNVTRSCCIVGF